MRENAHSLPLSANTSRRVSVLGCTGSIGSSTLKVLRHAPERFTLEAITAHENVDALAAIAREFRPHLAVIGNPAHYDALRQQLSGTGVAAAAGEAALVEAALHPSDVVVCAVVGIAALKPTLAAVERGAHVAIANKECLVAAGPLLMQRAAAHGATLIPVDSEHNAIFQVFDHAHPERVKRITLTASGGPFRTWSTEQMASATPEAATCHPNWQMGAKISVDSATLMNKGLELIEACHLFSLPPAQVEVLIHPESIVHALVAYADGSVLAQLSAPDMCTPIAHALAWPERVAAPVAPLDLATLGALHFEAPDHARFPALALARAAAEAGGAAPVALNAANEAAVRAFLEGRMAFLDIVRTAERAVHQWAGKRAATLEDIFAVDADARAMVG